MKRILTYQNTLKYEGKNFKTSYIQCHPRLKQTAVWANETTADGEASTNTIIIEMRNFIKLYYQFTLIWKLGGIKLSLNKP